MIYFVLYQIAFMILCLAVGFGLGKMHEREGRNLVTPYFDADDMWGDNE